MGGGYPYGYPQSNPAFPRANDVDPVKRADFERMDTNNDRVISNLDDPYLPYYPGDQYVDWVGISLYNTRESGGQTYPSQATSITAILDGAGPDSFNNFYDRFSKVARKPFCLSETGAAWQSNLQGTTVTVGEQTEESIKLDWWNRVMAVIGNPKYPNFKGAVWFEESKSENAFTNPAVFVNKNYRVTFSPTIAAQINAAWDLKTGIIVEAGAVKVTCSGEIVV